MIHLILSLLLTLPTFAEEQVDDPLIVNIRKPIVGLSDLPLDIGDGDRDLSQTISELPNLNFSSGANRPRFFQLRGIGETSQFEHAQVNAFGVFYEGIDLSEEASTVPWLKRETLSLAYGPQSIDWGGKALAGSLEVTSCLKGGCPSHRAELSVGNYNTRALSGGSALNDKSFSLLAAGGYLESDGYYFNDYLNRPTSFRDEKSAVLGLSYTLGAVKIREHHMYVEHRNGYDSWAFSPSFKTLSDNPGRDDHQVHGHSFQYQASLGEGWSLKGLSSVTVTQQRESYDEDWANDPYWNQIPGWNQPYNYFARFERHRSKFHQKLMIVNSSGFENGLHFYYYNENQVIWSFQDESERRVTKPRLLSKHLAYLSRKTWSLGDWSLTAAGRVEKQNVSLDGIGDRREQDVPLVWGADLLLRREWSNRRVSEFTLKRGFLGAGFNTDSSLGDERIKFGPEELYLAEAGLRREFESTTVGTRVFYQHQEHRQSRSSVQLDPMDPNTFTYYTDNRGRSQGYGLELFAAEKFRRWTLSGTAGYLEAREIGGRRLEQAPRWTYQARLEHGREHGSAYIQARGRDAYFHSEDHDYKSKPYHLADIGASWKLGRWQLTGSVQNLFDTRYVVRAYHFANEPPAWETKNYEQLGSPRTYAASLAFEF